MAPKPTKIEGEATLLEVKSPIPGKMEKALRRAVPQKMADFIFGEVTYELQAGDMPKKKPPERGRTYGGGENITRAFTSPMQDTYPDDEFGFPTIDLMLKTGTVRFALELKKAAVLSALFNELQWQIECEDEKLREVVEADMKRVFATYGAEMLTMLEYGSFFGELIWEYAPATMRGLESKDKWWVLEGINTVKPETVDHINRVRDGKNRGRFDGFVQKADSPWPEHAVPVDQALILTFRKKWRNLWGESALKAAYPLWYWFDIILAAFIRYLDRCGIPLTVCEAPMKGRMKMSDGTWLSTMDYALLTATEATRSQAIGLPSDVNPETGKPLFNLRYLADDKRGDQFIGALKFVADLLTRSIIMGAMADISKEGGGYNREEAHWGMTQLDNQQILSMLVSQLARYHLPRYAVYNATPTTYIDMRLVGLDPDRIGRVFKFLSTAGNQAEGDALNWPNWELIFQLSGIPTISEKEVEKLKKEREEKALEMQQMMKEKKVGEEGPPQKGKEEEGEKEKEARKKELEEVLWEVLVNGSPILLSTDQLEGIARNNPGLFQEQTTIELYNPHHDELGRFASREGARAIAGQIGDALQKAKSWAGETLVGIANQWETSSVLKIQKSPLYHIPIVKGIKKIGEKAVQWRAAAMRGEKGLAASVFAWTLLGKNMYVIVGVTMALSLPAPLIVIAALGAVGAEFLEEKSQWTQKELGELKKFGAALLSMILIAEERGAEDINLALEKMDSDDAGTLQSMGFVLRDGWFVTPVKQARILVRAVGAFVSESKLEYVELYNPYHDELGRFASKTGARTISGRPSMMPPEGQWVGKKALNWLADRWEMSRSRRLPPKVIADIFTPTLKPWAPVLQAFDAALYYAESFVPGVMEKRAEHAHMRSMALRGEEGAVNFALSWATVAAPAVLMYAGLTALGMAGVALSPYLVAGLVTGTVVSRFLEEDSDDGLENLVVFASILQRLLNEGATHITFPYDTESKKLLRIGFKKFEGPRSALVWCTAEVAQAIVDEIGNIEAKPKRGLEETTDPFELHNPYHDERGQFASKERAVTVSGADQMPHEYKYGTKVHKLVNRKKFEGKANKQGDELAERLPGCDKPPMIKVQNATFAYAGAHVDNTVMLPLQTVTRITEEKDGGFGHHTLLHERIHSRERTGQRYDPGSWEEEGTTEFLARKIYKDIYGSDSPSNAYNRYVDRVGRAAWQASDGDTEAAWRFVDDAHSGKAELTMPTDGQGWEAMLGTEYKFEEEDDLMDQLLGLIEQKKWDEAKAFIEKHPKDSLVLVFGEAWAQEFGIEEEE